MRKEASQVFFSEDRLFASENSTDQERKNGANDPVKREIMANLVSF
jgi:hypothetical protein